MSAAELEAPAVVAAARGESEPMFAAAPLAADGLNPYTGRQEREQVFQFAVKPTVEKKADGYVIRFASKTACDATIAIVDKDGIGAYGSADCRGKSSPVPDPESGELRPRREGDPEGLKSPLAEPDIAFIDPTYTAVTDEALYVLDRANERIVRAALEYHIEEVMSLP